MAVKQHASWWQRLWPLGPYFVFMCISVLLLLPLLAPGFILTLDMNFTPQIPFPTQVTSSYLFYAGLHIVNFVLPGDIIQKIILLTIFSLAGIGMYRLFAYVSGEKTPVYAPYVAGLLYMINPFVYSRLMAGQFAVLLGYACLPFFITSFLRLIQKPSLHNGALMTGWLTLIGILSIHTLALAGVVVVVGSLLVSWEYRKRTIILRKIAIAVLGVIGASGVASIYWIVPLLSGKNTTAQAIAGFGAADQAAFATAGDGIVGQFINIAGLQGFWADAVALYTLPQNVMTAWPFMTLGVWILVIYGCVVAWRSANRTTILIFLLSALVAVGFALSLAAPLLAYLPFAIGLREPHKFVGLVAVAYAIFTGYASIGVVDKLKKLYSQKLVGRIGVVAFMILPLAWTPTMLGGMYGQLQPSHYPDEWYKANELLNKDQADFKALFLPWHGYQYFDFAGRIVATPADKFFDKPTLVSNELEFRQAAPTFPDETKAYITKTLLPGAHRDRDLGEKLAKLDIKYVIVVREETATYMMNQPDLDLVYDTQALKLYKNKAFKG